MKTLTAALLATTSLAFAPLALAQEVYDLDEITVSANQKTTLLSQSGSTVEVMTDREISSNAGVKLMDRLLLLPGVTMTANGGLGAATAMKIRGIDATYIPVNFDGIDLFDPSKSDRSFDFGTLTGADVSRVEILKGSQSARYGSGAIGGVVTLESWTPTETGTSGRVVTEFGTYGTISNSLSVGNRSERGMVALSFSKVKSDGFSTLTSNTEADGYDSKQLSLKGSYALSEALTLGGAYIYKDTTSAYDYAGWSGTDPVDDDFLDKTQKGGRINAEYRTGNFVGTLAYSDTVTDRTDLTGYNTKFDGERNRIDATGSFDLGAHRLSFGASRIEDSSVTETSYGTQSRDSISNNSLYGEADLALNSALNVVVSARYDNSDKFDGQGTGRIAASWQFADDWTLRGVAGTGYSFPSLIALGSYYGNPDFGPEKSKTFELGLERAIASNGFVKATLFYNKMSDKIEWVQGSTVCPYGVSDPVYGGCYEQQSYTSKGLELSSGVDLAGDARIEASFTYTDAQHQDGSPLARAPERKLVLAVSKEFNDRLSGQMSFNYSGGITPSAYDSSPKVKDYLLVNASASYSITPDAEAYLRVENLLDRDYEIAGGYNTSGRALYVGLRSTF